MSAREDDAEKCSGRGAREPRERAGARVYAEGDEGTGGEVTRRRSFWLAVSGSGRRVAFHEAAGSSRRLRESAVFCVYIPRVHPRPRARTRTRACTSASSGRRWRLSSISIKSWSARGEQPASAINLFCCLESAVPLTTDDGVQLRGFRVHDGSGQGRDIEASSGGTV